MVFRRGSFTEQHGTVSYTVYVDDPLRWSLYCCSDSPDAFVVIDELYVESNFRGQGIGSQLLTQIKNFCQKNDIIFICLWLDKQAHKVNLDEMAAWYERRGFIYSAPEIPMCDSAGMQPMLCALTS